MCCSGRTKEERWEKGEEGLMMETIIPAIELVAQDGSGELGSRTNLDAALDEVLSNASSRIVDTNLLVDSIMNYRATRFCFDGKTGVYDMLINGTLTDCSNDFGAYRV